MKNASSRAQASPEALDLIEREVTAAFRKRGGTLDDTWGDEDKPLPASDVQFSNTPVRGVGSIAFASGRSNSDDGSKFDEVSQEIFRCDSHELGDFWNAFEQNGYFGTAS